MITTTNVPPCECVATHLLLSLRNICGWGRLVGGRCTDPPLLRTPLPCSCKACSVPPSFDDRHGEEKTKVVAHSLHGAADWIEKVCREVGPCPVAVYGGPGAVCVWGGWGGGGPKQRARLAAGGLPVGLPSSALRLQHSPLYRASHWQPPHICLLFCAIPPSVEPTRRASSASTTSWMGRLQFVGCHPVGQRSGLAGAPVVARMHPCVPHCRTDAVCIHHTPVCAMQRLAAPHATSPRLAAP